MTRSNAQIRRPVENGISTPKSIRVIHVDDDESFLKITKTYLKRINDTLEVHSFSDPEEAFEELVDNSRTRFSCVVSDFQLGDSSGIDLFLKIRTKLEIPFIIFTGKGREEVAIRALNLGVDRYIKKGKDMESQFRELNFAIQEVVARERMAQQYESLFQEIPIGLLTADIEGNIHSINKTGLQLLGSPNVEATKSINMLTFPPLQKSGISTDLEQCIETKQNIQTERRYKTKWGKAAIFKIKMVPLLDENKEVYLVLVSFDYIIDAASHQIQLQQSEEQLKSIIDNTTNVIWLIDPSTGQFRLVNKKFEEVCGVSRDKIIGRKLEELDIFAPSQIKQFFARDREVKEKKRPIEFLEKIAVNEQEHTYLTVSFPLLNADNEVYALCGVSTNITELEAHRNELSDFVHFMAHDLSSSLTVLSGFTQLLQEGFLQEDSSVTDLASGELYIKKILTQITSIQTLLDQSLELADAGIRIDPEKMLTVDLNTLIWEISEIFVPTSIEFVAKNLPIISSAREKLIQVFKNLLENAVIHGNPKRMSVEYQVTLEGRKELIFENDGVMIPPERISKIFERGFSTRRGGTGLGLTIVQKVIEALGWSISCHSTPEITQFIIRMG